MLVEVRDEERAVWGIHDVHGAKSAVGTAQHRTDIAGLEASPARQTLDGDHHTVNRIEREQFSIEIARHRCSFGDCEEMREALDEIRRAHHRQFAERVRIARRAKLARVDTLFQIVAALDVVPASRFPAIVAGVEAALGVDLETKSVAAPFGENLVGARLGMIAPDHAAFEVDPRRVRWVESGPCDAAGSRAALRAVKPAVHAPHQPVGDRVRVFESKPGKVHDGRAIGYVVVIGVGIKQQIRRVHDPDAAAPGQRSAGHVQAVDENLMPVEPPVAIGVFVDADEVAAAVVVGRRRRNLVIVGSVVLVATEHLEPGGIGILAVLGDPKPAALIEAQMGGLGDERFSQELLDSELAVGLERLERFGGRQLVAMNELCGLAQDTMGFMVTIECSAGRPVRARAAEEPGAVVVGSKLPFAFHHAFVEIIHHEWGLSKEAARAGMVVDADGDLVPFALVQKAGRNLVPVIAGAAGLEARRKFAARADAAAVNENFVGIGQVANVERDGLLEQVSLVLGEKAVVRLEPGAIPGKAIVAPRYRGSIRLPGAGHLNRLPHRRIRRPSRQSEARQEGSEERGRDPAGRNGT